MKTITVKTHAELNALVAEKVTKPYCCRTCGGSEFKRYPSSGFRYCPPCEKTKRRNWYSKNKSSVSESRKKKIPSPQFREYQWKWRIKSRYGITDAQYNDLLKSQGGGCAICGTTDNGKRRLTVDHCHATEAVRGILCDSCNIGLSKFKDDPSRLLNAFNYLNKICKN